MTPLSYRKAPGRALGQFLPKVTKKAFEKYGFATASLATDWAMIVGDDTAAKAAPERISWPRVPHLKPDDADAGCGRQGATLILRVKPAYAIEIQYGLTTIADRVNSYFGYRAIEKIKILQGEFTATASAATNAKPRERATPNAAQLAGLPLQDVRGDKLKSALERLAANVLRD